MEFNNSLFTADYREMAIDRQFLTVTPETSLSEAIALMSGKTSISVEKTTSIRHSCALVVSNGEIAGIITERDIVKLTAQAIAIEGATAAQVMTTSVVTLKEENFRDVFAALFLFRRYQIRHLPLVDENNQLVGLITPETIRRGMRPTDLLKLRKVSDVMSLGVVTAEPHRTVFQLAQLMSKRKVSCVVIVREDNTREMFLPVGIVTERDILQFRAMGLNFAEDKAEQVMSSPLLLLSPDDSLLTARETMNRKKVRRLVVSWNWGQGLGIITQTSLLKIFDPMEMYGAMEALQHTVQQLERENQQLRDKLKATEY